MNQRCRMIDDRVDASVTRGLSQFLSASLPVTTVTAQEG